MPKKNQLINQVRTEEWVGTFLEEPEDGIAILELPPDFPNVLKHGYSLSYQFMDSRMRAEISILDEKRLSLRNMKYASPPAVFRGLTVTVRAVGLP